MITTPALALTPEISTANPNGNINQIQEEKTGLDIDWITLGLGMVALLFAGGLIPFWMWIYFTFNPPIR